MRRELENSKLEDFIKNKARFGITNYSSSISYSELVKNIADGKLKDEHAIIDASLKIILVRNAIAFVKLYPEIARKMFEVFSGIVEYYKTDILHDFQFLLNTNEKIYFWMLRKTGSDITTSKDEVKIYAERNDLFYRIEKGDDDDEYSIKNCEIIRELLVGGEDEKNTLQQRRYC